MHFPLFTFGDVLLFVIESVWYCRYKLPSLWICPYQQVSSYQFLLNLSALYQAYAQDISFSYEHIPYLKYRVQFLQFLILSWEDIWQSLYQIKGGKIWSKVDARKDSLPSTIDKSNKSLHYSLNRSHFPYSIIWEVIQLSPTFHFVTLLLWIYFSLSLISSFWVRVEFRHFLFSFSQNLRVFLLIFSWCYPDFVFLRIYLSPSANPKFDLLLVWGKSEVPSHHNSWGIYDGFSVKSNLRLRIFCRNRVYSTRFFHSNMGSGCHRQRFQCWWQVGNNCIIAC